MIFGLLYYPSVDYLGKKSSIRGKKRSFDSHFLDGFIAISNTKHETKVDNAFVSKKEPSDPIPIIYIGL